jgi:ABC-type polysaccharide/polyol phosphate export permease
VVEAFRFAFTGAGAFPFVPYAASAMVTILVVFFGLILFHRAEQTFVDVA